MTLGNAALALLLFSAPALAQDDASHCDAVLRYTGREMRLVRDLKIDSSWSMYVSQKAQRLNIMTPSGVLDWKKTSQTGGQQNRYWRSEFFETNDLVFGPAVQAWSACVQAAKNSHFRLTPTVGDNFRSLQVAIYPVIGSDRLLQGIHAPNGLSCTITGQATRISQSMNVTLPSDRVTNLRCERTGPSLEKLTVGIVLSSGRYDFQLPAAEGVLRPFVRDTAKMLAEFAGCAQSAHIAPAAYARELNVWGEMRGKYNSDASVGRLRILINDDVVSHEEPKRPNWTPRGTFEYSSIVVLPAFTPGVVRSEGGVQNGDCEIMTTRVMGVR